MVASSRLKKLELNGYKTFANKTTFLFPDGITAIVGPNGSGKSNIADALRWVLGEQSYQVLRGKRSEDMIFAGNKHRARLGMAQVSVTLDNSEQWLPIEFSEVVITRRTFRSGENEYLLNGKRVRLKQITSLLAETGLARRTYTVIGQGLVDRVLSLRPEERRTLFEEAAGITGYQRQRKLAISRLEETKANLVRLNDILAEIAPRLKHLERQAQRARQKENLADQLTQLHLTWYGHQWYRVTQRVEQQQAIVNQWQQRVQKQRDQLKQQEQHLAQLEQAQNEARQTLQAWHQQRAAIHQQAEALQNELTLVTEKRRLALLRQEELNSELLPLRTYLTSLQEKITVAETTLQQFITEMATVTTVVDQLKAAKASQEAAHQEKIVRLRQARQIVLERTARVAEAQQRQQRLEQQIDAAQAQQAEQTKALTSLEAKIAAQKEAISALEQALATARQDSQQAEQALQAAEIAVKENESARLAAQRRLDASGLEVQKLVHQQETLSRLREEGAGLYNGVREVVKAAHKRQLTGIIGIVGELIQVPPELEKAVEVALGGSLQDIVVQHWADAETAIALLKRERAGRATFLPLDTLHPPKAVTPPNMPGVIGVAADLVQSSKEVAPAVRLLLQRTLLVETLATARKALPRASGFRIVTVAGELVRSSGRITGGADRRKQSGVLTREREWRALPKKIATARQQEQEAQQQLQQIVKTLSKVQKERQQAQQRLSAEQQALRRHEQNGQTASAELKALQNEWQWRQKETTRHAGEQERWQNALQEAAAQAQNAQTRFAAAEASVRQLEQEINDEDADNLFAQLNAAQQQLALLKGRRQDQVRFIADLKADLQRQTSLIAQKEARLSTLAAEVDQIEVTISEAKARYDQIKQTLVAQEAPIPALEEKLNSLAVQLRAAEAKERQIQQQLHNNEIKLNETILDHRRAQDKQGYIRQEIEEHLGLVSAAGAEAPFRQEALPLSGVAELPVVYEIPAGLEKEIKQIRLRLRRLGHVDPEVIHEFEALQQRYSFLRAQMDDLEEAIRNLHDVIHSLDETMKKAFMATFQEVAKRFSKYFKELFGGGTARLALSNPETINESGIDVYAHPPGKRPQTLALLSGGERTLTAAALLFSILDVSPPPFCVLDEVDAALDEANVTRFREHLQRLSQHTQFIVITHNRGTVEAANTIYGITAGRDNTSQALSLSLKEVTDQAGADSAG